MAVGALLAVDILGEVVPLHAAVRVFLAVAAAELHVTGRRTVRQDVFALVLFRQRQPATTWIIYRLPLHYSTALPLGSQQYRPGER
jgi:hypothetical protein